MVAPCGTRVIQWHAKSEAVKSLTEVFLARLVAAAFAAPRFLFITTVCRCSSQILVADDDNIAFLAAFYTKSSDKGKVVVLNSFLRIVEGGRAIVSRANESQTFINTFL